MSSARVQGTGGVSSSVRGIWFLNTLVPIPSGKEERWESCGDLRFCWF